MLTGTSNRHRHILTLGATVASTCPVELTLPNLPPGAGAKLTSAHTSDLTQTLPPPPLPVSQLRFRKQKHSGCQLQQMYFYLH